MSVIDEATRLGGPALFRRVLQFEVVPGRRSEAIAWAAQLATSRSVDGLVETAAWASTRPGVDRVALWEWCRSESVGRGQDGFVRPPPNVVLRWPIRSEGELIAGCDEARPGARPGAIAHSTTASITPGQAAEAAEWSRQISDYASGLTGQPVLMLLGSIGGRQTLTRVIGDNWDEIDRFLQRVSVDGRYQQMIAEAAQIFDANRIATLTEERVV